MQSKSPPWAALECNDPEVKQLIDKEFDRQKNGIELIASENFASPAVIQAYANVFTNKYAEGYPGKRYYGGCAVVDELENLAIARAKQLFKVNCANVQPHSGAQANAAVFLTLLKPGDTILGLSLSEGGHLTHGSSVNSSGIYYHIEHYSVSEQDHRLDYVAIMDQAKQVKPRLIIAGASAYSRSIDFKKFREIADAVGAYLLVDMAHIAGLVATGLHPDPCPYAHVVTTTTHKTLRGPRGGLILWNDAELNFNKGVFPGTQGGPLEHVVAAKAVALKEALQPSFREYQKQVLANATLLASELAAHDLPLITGGTDNHLLMVDVSAKGLTGKLVERALGEVEITVNKNTIPFDQKSPFVTSGIRLGTPAVTTRGFDADAIRQTAGWIAEVVERVRAAAEQQQDQQKPRWENADIRKDVLELCQRYPLYAEWS